MMRKMRMQKSGRAKHSAGTETGAVHVYKDQNETRGTRLQWDTSSLSLFFLRLSHSVSLSLQQMYWMTMAQQEVMSLWAWLRCIVIEAAQVLQSCSVTQLVLILRLYHGRSLSAQRFDGMEHIHHTFIPHPLQYNT